jgi:hypothetical protein
MILPDVRLMIFLILSLTKDAGNHLAPNLQSAYSPSTRTFGHCPGQFLSRIRAR